MCTVLGAAAGVQIAGSLLQAGAARQHGSAAKQADDLSAVSAEKAAASAVERGNLKDLQEAMKGDAVVVQQLVAQSGSGADVNVGAPAATRRASGAVLEVSRKIVRYNAALEAMGLREHARRYYQEGENAEAEGKSAFVGTLLSGGAKMIGMGGKLAADSVGSELPTPDQQYRDDTLRLEH
jgi:hypothetical protein